MLDPYRMVLVNIIASALVLAGTLFYRYIYPKKKINLFVLLLIISILPIISIFRTGAYESGDFNIHIYRIMSFYDSLKEGILMPSWAAELNATYGNPLFIFNYPLPYYVISFLHFLGLSFISSMKLYLGLTLYLSGIFMYLLFKELSNNKLAAFTAAIFYIFNPYHLIDVHFRATLGESTIFTLVPLLFLFIVKYLKEDKKIYLVLIIFFTDLLFLAHPLLAGVFLGIAVLYVILFAKNTRRILSSIASLLIGAFSSIYTWSPFYLYSQYMFKFNEPSVRDISFYPFYELFVSPWRFGFLFQGPKGELAQIIGYTQILVVLLSITLIVFKKIQEKIKKEYIFWLSLFFLTLFMMNPGSNFFWRYMPNIGSMLNLYGRLSLVLSFGTSVIAGYFILSFPLRKRPMFIYLLILITISYTILNWGHRRVIPEINDAVLRKNVWISTAVAEGTTAYFLNTKWADINNFWFSKRPDKPLDVLKRNATVKPIKRTSILHTYDVDAKTALTIRENTLYFPGWTLKSNNKIVNIYPGERGIINAYLPAGKQYLTLFYKDIPAYALTKTISGISFLVLILILVIYYLFSFLPIHNISPGKRKTQLGLSIKKGASNFISPGRK